MTLEQKEKKRFVRYKEGAKLYGVCQSTFEKWAKEAGATCKIGKAVIVDCEVFERYLETFRVPLDSLKAGLTPCPSSDLRLRMEEYAVTVGGSRGGIPKTQSPTVTLWEITRRRKEDDELCES